MTDNEIVLIAIGMLLSLLHDAIRRILQLIYKAMRRLLGLDPVLPPAPVILRLPSAEHAVA